MIHWKSEGEQYKQGLNIGIGQNDQAGRWILFNLMIMRLSIYFRLREKLHNIFDISIIEVFDPSYDSKN